MLGNTKNELELLAMDASALRSAISVNMPFSSGTLIISPHSDDAAFSLGALLASRALPQPIHINTVLSISGFSCENQHGIPDLVSKIRQNEDREYAANIGANIEFMGRSDALLRLSDSKLSALFEGSSLDPVMVQNLELEIGQLLSQRYGACLLFPCGIGRHIDHRLLASACRNIHYPHSFCYADQPYAGLNPVPPTFAEQRPAAIARCSDAVESQKASDVVYYQSQPASHRVARLLRSAASCDIVESIWKVLS